MLRTMSWKIRKEGWISEGAREIGFTLLEVLIAISILGLVLSTLYFVYVPILRLTHEGDKEVEYSSSVRIFFDRLSQDLMQMVPYGGNFEFYTYIKEIGTRKFLNLSFRTTYHLPLFPGDMPSAYGWVTYEVTQMSGKEGYTIVRREVPFSRSTLGKKNTAYGFPVCENVAYISYLFFDDEGRYYNSWGLAGGIREGAAPAAVMIRLELRHPFEEGKTQVYTTRIYLPWHKVEEHG